jgi:hypothetical protein
VSRFGQWTSPRHVEVAYVDLVSKWIMEYVAEAERQFGLDIRSVPVPAKGQFTVRRSEFIKWPQDQSPAVLVFAPGLVGEPRREADRTLTAPLGIGFGVVAAAGAIFEDAAEEVAQILGVCIREIVTHLPPEGIEVAGVQLLDEQYGEVDKRGLGSSRIIFQVWIKNWGAGKGGPFNREVPREDPYVPSGDNPIVQTTSVQLFNTRRIED